MVVGFTTTNAITAYHHQSCELESHSWQGVLDSTLGDKVCQWFSPSAPVSSTNKTDRHDITEILLKVALNTINHMFILQTCSRITVFHSGMLTLVKYCPYNLVLMKTCVTA